LEAGNKTRRRPAFRQHDLTRALKAAKGAGLVVARVEIDRTGKISIITKGEGENVHAMSPLEAWKARRDARPS
jgi:hypothetical protein